MGEANQRGDFNARREQALASEREVRSLRKRVVLLAAIVRREGRVRVTKAELDAIGVSYSMTQKVEGDTVTLTWNEPDAAG